MNLRLTLNFDQSLWLTGWSLCPKSKIMKLYKPFIFIAEVKSVLAHNLQLLQLDKVSHVNLTLKLFFL
jgi:hypothetical protein